MRSWIKKGAFGLALVSALGAPVKVVESTQGGASVCAIRLHLVSNDAKAQTDPLCGCARETLSTCSEMPGFKYVCAGIAPVKLAGENPSSIEAE